MASIQAFRNSNPTSPFRYLYGQRNGLLLFPLDLTFTHFSRDVADGGGMFIGDPISIGGGLVGTILNYTWPPLGAVNPVVEVAPDPGFIMEMALALPPLPLPIQPPGTRVFADLGNGSTVGGAIRAALSGQSYLDAAHTIETYITQFDVPLRPDHHGAPVFLAASPGTVVGMVVSAQQTMHTPNAYVCPV